MQTLSRTLERDKSTVTVLVRKLTELGLVARKGTAGDGRVTMVSLTAKGTALRTPVLRVFLRTERDLAANLSPEEQETLFTLLGKVYNGLSGQNRLKGAGIRDACRSERLDVIPAQLREENPTCASRTRAG